MGLEYTPVDSIPKIVAASHASFRTNRTQDLKFRKEQLIALRRLISENMDELAGAITTDLGRPKDTEVPGSIAAVDFFIDNLELITQDKKGRGLASDDCFVRYSPYGVVLVIGAWNFPITLVLQPIMGAIAAGNVCIVKPSELSEATASLLTRLIAKYMDPSVLSVVNGGVRETSALLEQRFDHIFYTGNPQVGKIVMAAASKNLTPVALELGGKCPVIITNETDLVDAAKKVATWKTINCGQICITVDYVLCPKHLQEKFVQIVIGTWKAIFGEDIKSSKRYPRIVNRRHFDRIEKILEASKTQTNLVFGGKTDASKLFIEPTIFTNVSLSDDIMKEELFAPLLPIVTCDSIEEAISIINKNEHPLGLYLFSNNKNHVEKVLRETRSGAVVVNDIATQHSNHTLPFGGVGHSGMGAYHGQYSIETFSHQRAVIVRTQAKEAKL